MPQKADQNLKRIHGLPLVVCLMSVAGAGCSAANLEGDDSTAELQLVPPTDEFLAFAQDMAATDVVVLGGGSDSFALAPTGHGLGYVPSPVVLSRENESGEALLPSTSFEPSYDLRARGKLSPIRNQGACGDCWAFATYSQAESTLLPGEVANFSEEHLNNANGFDIPPCLGGNSNMSIAYLSRWSGPVAESDAPYTASAQTFANGLPARKHLEEALFIPDRAGPNENGGVKSAILTYGALFTTMAWTDSAWTGVTQSFYNPGPKSSSSRANHAVAIVGWNDAYPASKFAHAPPGPGAFIVRNSWGESFGDKGYFYVSYFDGFIGKDNAVFDTLAATTDFKTIYQYDAYGFTAAASYPSSAIFVANTFTPTEEGSLQAVSFWTTVPGTTYDVFLYDNPADSPSTGTLAGTVHGVQTFAGYHTVAVSSLGLGLRTGRRFSVVVRMQNAQPSSYLALEYPLLGYSSHVVAQAGRSFTGTDGKIWFDVGKAWKANLPIKAFAGAARTTVPPSCDDGNACTEDSWNGTTCVHKSRARGSVCRAAAGPCDVADMCDGTGAACPADRVAAAGTVCRAKAGDCDVAETCTGREASCPRDGYRPAGTSCGAGAVCTGTSLVCWR